MDSVASIFIPSLQKYTSQLLTRISAEYNIPIEEMTSKYMTASVATKPKAPRKPKAETQAQADRPPCPFLCGNKKTPCKNKCVPNGTGCHLHDPARLEAKAQAPPKPPREPKPPKVMKGDFLIEEHVPVVAEPEPKPEPEPEQEQDDLDLDLELEESTQERLRRMLFEEEEEEEEEEEDLE